MPTLLDLSRLSVVPAQVERPTALFSIDVESDFGTGRSQALSRLGALLEHVNRLGVPLTAFVEARLFEWAKPLCRMLLDSQVDVQLHCFDHATPGDSPETLQRGHAVYSDFCGRPPTGYRAHTYRLSHVLYETLIELGFAWDSSLQLGFGQGRQSHSAFRGGDILVFDQRLVEFPIGTWRRVPLPFTHSYSLLLSDAARSLLWAAGGPGRLAAYSMHMTDVVRSDTLHVARRSIVSRCLHRLMWARPGHTTFPELSRVVAKLRDSGYEFLTTQAMYERVAPGLRLSARGPVRSLTDEACRRHGSWSSAPAEDPCSASTPGRSVPPASTYA